MANTTNSPTIAQKGISRRMVRIRSRDRERYWMNAAPPPKVCLTFGNCAVTSEGTDRFSSSSCSRAFEARLLLARAVRASTDIGNSAQAVVSAAMPTATHRTLLYRNTPGE